MSRIRLASAHLLLLGWLLLSLVACASDGGHDPGEDDEVDTAEAAIGVPLPCADPGVIRHAGTFYVACTGEGPDGPFPIYSSPDLATWKYVGPGLSRGAALWGKGDWWAPEIHAVGDEFILYYSARGPSGKKRIGAARASSPEGPFQDLGAPLVRRRFSIIDAHLFIDGTGPQAKRWLYYKREGNGHDTTIYAQRLDASGLKRIGKPKKAFNFSRKWEGKLVEAPWIVKHGSYYYMLYSGDHYCNASYALGVARSKKPTGPFKPRKAPILKSGKRWRGPGHNSIVRDGSGVDWVVYHAFDRNEREPSCKDRENNRPRWLKRRKLVWEGGWPRAKAPTL